MHRQIIASGRVRYETPPEIFAPLNQEFRFTLDPCCTKATAKAPKYFTRRDNGLSQRWAPHRVWMNPPYGRGIGEWMAKAVTEWKAGALVVALVPSSTDTDWWHDFAMRGEVRFVKRRIRFVGEPSTAPFPSAIIVYR
jgi:phage N-6-adenine-methyltransferase